ncbi:hypothetical protein EBB79_03990 [Parasedimentitalea marina]|uniref:Uncharacterized protein n=1 Tax=Parasedimentitalea marina TaxID=2483033 RepID=A0A3T0MZE5_9RHOB|nr:hypothetical protein [Parasedimentitalea marina]AZV77134.1 hypothetical protein EBB79_03990 [Parasedimentitalea marina]
MRKSNLAEWTLAHRRLVVTLLVLVFAVLIGIRILVFPTLDLNNEIDWPAMGTSSLDALIATIVVSFVVAVTLWWTKPPLDRIPPGFEIPPTSISNTLEAEATLTNEWEYLGHTGRYVRNRIFPIVQKHSHQNNRRVNVRMMVLDPRNDALCGQYAKYRNRSRSSEMFKEDWTMQKVQEELIATVARTVLLNAVENHVHCELRFRNFLSQFRFDVSSDQVMVTQEDPQEPAFSYPRGSRFFEYYKRENQLIWDQSPSFDIHSITPEPDQMENGMAAMLSEFLGRDTADKTVERALELLAADRSPYA